MRKGHYTLRTRLLWATLSATLACGVTVAAAMIVVGTRQTHAAFDDALEEGARLALTLGERVTFQDELDATYGLATHMDNITTGIQLFYQLISTDGTLLQRSPGAPHTVFSSEPCQGACFSDSNIAGVRWRVYTLRGDHEVNVQIGQRHADRTAALKLAILHVAWPLTLLILLTTLAHHWLVKRLFAPLESLAARITRRARGDLSPISPRGQGQEVRPIVAALNVMLDRLSRVMKSERQFTSNAAHELRTPLAALDMRLQLMQRRAGEQEQEELNMLRREVTRMTRLTESLLLLARIDAKSRDALDAGHVDLAALTAQVSADCRAAAAKKNIEITTIGAGVVLGERSMIETLIRNLVDNAIKYGRPGGKVDIVMTEIENRTSLIVQDNGLGVDPCHLPQLTQRFFRAQTCEPGAGLGLSIVACIATVHGAELNIVPAPNGPGLSVSVQFAAHGLTRQMQPMSCSLDSNAG